jgi:hypothetical protein
MSLFNILSAALVALIFAAGLVLFTGLRAVSADPVPAPPVAEKPAP